MVMASMSSFGMRSWSSVTLPAASSTFWTVPLTRGVLAGGWAAAGLGGGAGVTSGRRSSRACKGGGSGAVNGNVSHPPLSIRACARTDTANAANNGYGTARRAVGFKA